MTAYAELQCTTNFCFLRGASHPEELVTQAKHLGLAALGLTDRNTLAGIVRAHAAAKDMGMKFIVGARLDLTSSNILTLRCAANGGASKGGQQAPSEPAAHASRLAVLAPQHEEMIGLLAYPISRAAYGRLCRLLSLGQRRAEKGQCILTLDDLHDFGITVVPGHRG